MTFVSGFGSSCSQPLFAKRPSHTVGSGRKIISSPPCAPAAAPAASAAGAGGLRCWRGAAAECSRGCRVRERAAAAARRRRAAAAVERRGRGRSARTNGVAGPPSATPCRG